MPARWLLVTVAVTALAACGGRSTVPDPDAGIARPLAAERARTIRDLRYELAFKLPPNPADPVPATAIIRFRREQAPADLVLDFAPGAAAVTSVASAGKPVAYRAVNGHLVIAGEHIRAGENLIEIAFRAGEAALNRNPEFLYSLFVPARAHLTFPCFDQPDLKARFTLELTVPAEWQAVSNGAEVSRETLGGSTRITYAPTQPISTYLFGFAAGRFEVAAAERHGRTFRMFHRETDRAKVERNLDAIFDLHAAALAWLEDYTGIPYPFGKFDFVAVPSFQFGGMEHPGSIYYNAASLLLDQSATENQLLGRASVIAHETAHMWFGDLVTMRWFDDVWMKEVFANFMAAKIVNPSFPNVNHELRFLTAHYPQAYDVDRTEGTHPIRQELANLNEAGSLYGAIIYQKAPIVMRQLERLLGQERFRDGLRAYLARYQMANATWTDLVQILDDKIDVDVAAWSRAWVEEAGRPTIHTELKVDAEGRIEELALRQSDPMAGRGLLWPQQMQVVIGEPGAPFAQILTLDGARTEVAEVKGRPKPLFVLPAGGGLAYGDFVLDEASRGYLLEHAAGIPNPLTRGAAWVTLWDEMVAGRIPPAPFADAMIAALGRERVEQNVQLLAGYAGETFWRFLPEAERSGRADRLETTLRSAIARAGTASLKSTLFTAFYSIATTDAAVAFVERVWRRQEKIPGLTLAEPDEATIALELAVRGIPPAGAILEEQRGRFQNPDRKARFEFVVPALSADRAVRDRFFESLRDPANRRREPWVLEGVRYLNHPLRAADAERHIRPALELVEEIRRTGDIFFPRNWLDAVLGGHSSPGAARTVEDFLAARADYPQRLRRLVLQTSHNLRQSARRHAAHRLPPSTASRF